MTNYDIDPTLVGKNTKPNLWSPSVERYLKMARPYLKPAAIGLLSAALLVGIIFYYGRVQTLASNSGNSSALATGWMMLLGVTTIMWGLLVAVGLPLLWPGITGIRDKLQIIAFEVAFLLIALIIAGFALFQATAANPPIPVMYPGGQLPNCPACLRPQD